VEKKLTAVTGFKDILPEQSSSYGLIEEFCRELFARSGFKEIRTPMLEKTELFTRGIGEGTDIVEKEMYTFLDKNGESLTLRPEGTAPVVRAYIEHNIGMQEQIFKAFYIGPMFRHERPQKGRFRQFHQIGVEIFNVASPSAEAELIVLLDTIQKQFEIKNLMLQVNSVGCPRCRPEYSTKLQKYLQQNKNKLCDNCRRRMEVNPLRTLDCKNESCRTVLELAPVISGQLCDECKLHFNLLQQLLGELNIKFQLNPHLVRGLDYYTKTCFELVTPEEGAQNAIAAGGRYDNLIQMLGGNPTPAVGFAIGLERLLRHANIEINTSRPSLFIATLGTNAFSTSLKLANLLRKKGLYVETGYGDRSLKSQMRLADKLKARFVLMVGEDELKSRVAILKNMDNSEQTKIPIDSEETFLNSILNKLK